MANGVWWSCFSFQFYIKPQPNYLMHTSWTCCFSFQFYIKPQLLGRAKPARLGCFSFQFYIKPQLNFIKMELNHRCFSFQFYIKPQLSPAGILPFFVVSHSNSTSNHNYVENMDNISELFLIPILHQTTTSRMAVIHILHVTHMTPMHKTSCRTPGKLVGCNFVFQRAVYQKNSSC